LNKVTFALVIHSHQPVGNFDHVVEDAYQKAYAPFLRALIRHPRIRMGLHFSGNLFEWIETRHPEYFKQLRQLLGRGQIEIIGGGYYEPILPVIPDDDKNAQIRKLADYIHEHFGVSIRGAWVAERVWEPSLARPLAGAGVDYVVLDDTHFVAAGLEPSELHGSYITEESGAPLRLVPSLKALRYTIPFQEPEETLRVLREGIGQPGALFAMGDDCEKFGVWPGTYQHCYTNGWLERFFLAIENAGEWLETTTLSDYLDRQPPLGRIYLPTASYSEMMEWALPTRASMEFKACLEEVERLPKRQRFERFLRGGLWRNFLSKYSEANQLHKLMLQVSRRCQEVSLATAGGTQAWQQLSEARDHIMAGQCNDPYWHGVFGGLYATHLRSALLRHLIQAEALLDQVESGGNPCPVRVEHKDFDVDGFDEVLLNDSTFSIVLRPSDGGTISSLRFKPSYVELINSLQRRPEAYHELVRHRVRTQQVPREGPASIHDMVLSKESNLEALLRYDRYARNAFRTYVFPASKQWRDFDLLRLDEHRDLAMGPWSVSAQGPAGMVEVRREAQIRTAECELALAASKTITTQVSDGTWILDCRSTLSTDHSCPVAMSLGLELVLNLLAPDAHDRYIFANEVRRPLEFRGEIAAPRLLLVDEWQRVTIGIEARPEPRWWIVPIETVSQSEAGFERVYQGSAIMAVWKIEPPSWRNMACSLRMEISRPK
jgi:hypothetical protein